MYLIAKLCEDAGSFVWDRSNHGSYLSAAPALPPHVYLLLPTLQRIKSALLNEKLDQVLKARPESASAYGYMKR